MLLSCIHCMNREIILHKRILGNVHWYFHAVLWALWLHKLYRISTFQLFITVLQRTIYRLIIWILKITVCITFTYAMLLINGRAEITFHIMTRTSVTILWQTDLSRYFHICWGDMASPKTNIKTRNLTVKFINWVFVCRLHCESYYTWLTLV